jgi:hypothetical protein
MLGTRSSCFLETPPHMGGQNRIAKSESARDMGVVVYVVYMDSARNRESVVGIVEKRSVCGDGPDGRTMRPFSGLWSRAWVGSKVRGRQS